MHYSNGATATLQQMHRHITGPGNDSVVLARILANRAIRASILNTGMCNNAQHMLLEAYLASFFEKEYPLQHEEDCHT